MKKAKYLQLLNAASHISNALTLHDQQLTILSGKCKTTCAEISSNLSSMQQTVQEIDPNGCISSLQFETLHKFKTELEKIAKTLTKDLLKPAMQTDKELAAIKQNIELKISPALSEPSDFDLEVIKQLLQRSRPLLESCQQRVNACLADINIIQSKLDEVDKSIHRLDLPNDIQQATKDVEKATQDLSSLTVHLAQLPQGKERYRTEFLPLRAALEKLSLQSSALLKESPAKSPTSSEAPPAVLKNKV